MPVCRVVRGKQRIQRLPELRFIAGKRGVGLAEEARLRQTLDALFTSDEATDWQKVAAAVALTRRISVISGGPGTGKTTTVAKLLAALIQLSGEQKCRIRLAAPTGKAAARLTESLGGALQKLPLTQEQLALFPNEASTLHRLLGAQPGSQRLRYHAGNPLHLDVLVVDEASMIDLTMMSRLIDALPPHARVIFLGDRDQLASVEAGAVLGDICTYASLGYTAERAEELARLTGCSLAAESQSLAAALRDSLCLLQKSYRNTIEISNFAGEVLKKASQGGYQIDPVIRHGKPVEVIHVSSQDLLHHLEMTLQSVQKKGFETIAVICRTEDEAAKLKSKLHMSPARDDTSFHNGVMVLPVSLTKGLEFDCVILWEPDETRYSDHPKDAKLLYVAITRALHELYVMTAQPLSPLLSSFLSEKSMVE